MILISTGKHLNKKPLTLIYKQKTFDFDLNDILFSILVLSKFLEFDC